MSNKTLQQRCNRIREIDKEIDKLFSESNELYYSGLSPEQHNRLWSMVIADGEPHWN